MILSAIIASNAFAVLSGVAVSVSTVAATTYVIYNYSEEIFGSFKKDVTSDEFVYMAVKYNPAFRVTAILDELTYEDGENKIKNYHCHLLTPQKNYLDKNCTLIRWNNQPTPSESIDISSLTAPTQEITEKSLIQQGEPMILKISKNLYAELIKHGGNRHISLVKKGTRLVVFGAVNRLFDLIKNPKDSTKDVKSNLFLMRIKSNENSFDFTEDVKNFKCKWLSNSVDCRVYKANSKNHTNNLTSHDLSLLADPVSADKDVGKYLVIDFGKNRFTVDQLKANAIDLIPASDEQAASPKKLNLEFDQILYGHVPLNNTLSTVYPVAPALETYLVTKKKDATFNGITDKATKNYKCKYTANSKTTEDHSCVLKSFPDLVEGEKIHKYSDILSQKTFKSISETEATNNEHLLLTLDANKLFNLKGTWTPDSSIDVEVVSSSTGSVNAGLTLVHKVEEGAAKGKTKFALVKYAGPGSDSSSVPTGKCAFTETDTNGFDCSFKQASDATITQIEKLDFATTDATSFTANNYYALVATDLKNISDFKDKTKIHFTTTAAQNNKHQFDLVALMDGCLTPNKKLFFLENPRDIPVVPASAPAVPVQ